MTALPAGSPHRASDVPLPIEGCARFRMALRAHPTATIPFDALVRLFADAFPDRPRGVDERQWLLAAIRDANEAGACRLPTERGRGWDRSRVPSVPRWVRRIVAPITPTPKLWRDFAWHPLLAWVPDAEERFTDADVEFLQRVHAGLITGTFTTPAPIKYRSLTLTGDEKRLGQLAGGKKFFGPGRLSLDLLGCARDLLPIAWTPIGGHQRPVPTGGERVLMLENSGAFVTMLASLEGISATGATPPYTLVAYGHGNAGAQAVAWLARIGRRIQSLHYLGDLDWDGLAIATAVREAAVATGLPEPVSAPGGVAAMLTAAHAMGHPEGWPHERAREQQASNALLTFLPMDVRRTAARILHKGQRVPEEVLGPAELAHWWGARS